MTYTAEAQAPNYRVVTSSFVDMAIADWRGVGSSLILFPHPAQVLVRAILRRGSTPTGCRRGDRAWRG